MQISTGHTFRLDDPAVTQIPAHDLVLVQGTEDQVEELSRRVRLGSAEMQKRTARRKQQRASRKRNR